MKITVAIDSLKGSLTSMEAGNAAKDGILRVYPEAEVFVRPLADGGEGTVDALTEGLGGRIRTISVSDPLGRPLQADYGILTSPGQGEPLAVIEMAAASGLPLLAATERNPLRTTTYGVGELILDAIRQGCRRFLIGIGGSATNDGGLGMLSALGYQFLKEDGTPVSPGAAGLSELSSIRTGSVLPELPACSFRIACDVTNPLCGPNGCSAVYGPQKGASREDIVNMDRWMQAYAVLTSRQFPHADPTVPGTGAAGGLGFAFLSYMNAVLEPGASIVLEETSLESFIRDSDIVITGEGRLDGQTAMGKAPIAVARLAKKYGKPVFAFSGCVTPDAIQCNDAGIDAFFPILRSICSLEEAMEPASARKNLSDTVEQVMRVVRRFS